MPQNIMLGRGALAVPNLSAWIKGDSEKLPWLEIYDLLLAFAQYKIEGDKGLYYSNRVKQWLSYLKMQYSEAQPLFRQARTIRKQDEMVSFLEQEKAIFQNLNGASAA